LEANAYEANNQLYNSFDYGLLRSDWKE